MKKPIITLKPGANQVVAELFNLVVSNQFDEFIPLWEIREVAKKNILSRFDESSDNERQDYIKSLRGFNFFDQKNYLSNLDHSLMNNLNSCKHEILGYLDITYNKNRKSYKLVRSANPPVETYGHDGLMVIKPSNTDFFHLFF